MTASGFDRSSIPSTGGDDDPRVPAFDVPWDADAAAVQAQAQEQIPQQVAELPPEDPASTSDPAVPPA